MDTHMRQPDSTLLSVVLPAHNEEAGIAHVIEVIGGVLDSTGLPWEIVVVDDGSRDRTFDVLKTVSQANHRVRAIRFSRNFGKEAALLAGLNTARGDAVITMDADLQHPPKHIPAMVEAWKRGAKVVDAVKRSRETDSAMTRLRAKVFNTLLSKMGGVNLDNSSDFKLLDRVVVNTITQALPERQRFYRGLTDWVGFSRERLLFDVEERASGAGKWSIRGLVGLAITAIVSFTSAPLRIVTGLGLATLVFGLLVAGEALWGWFQGRAVSGFTTTIFTLLIIGSFIMISLGIIGEYIAKIYDEIKRRPVYLIEHEVGADSRLSPATSPTTPHHGIDA
jgi:glycosyltransferase involved in cell wall biosynthesis